MARKAVDLALRVGPLRIGEQVDGTAFACHVASFLLIVHTILDVGKRAHEGSSMRHTLAGAALVALSMIGANAMAQDSVDLTGLYTITSGEKYGSAEPTDRIANHTVRFSPERVVVIDEKSKEIYAATYIIDTKSKPWKITMTSKLDTKEDAVAQGLIEKDGDTIRLIYALPDGQAPTEFRTTEKQLMFVMKRKGK
jgi:uncharacterized protein (TIGR03067 family)